MQHGVVYKFRTGKKINGTLFYCFEYFRFLKQFVDAKFYIVGISPDDLSLVLRLFSEKYNADITDIVPVTTTQLYLLKLDRTLILDVNTFYDCKEFLTNQIYCYSNDSHSMFRYKNHRTVTYYGSYDYQNYDKFEYLKFNFDIFKPSPITASGVYISCASESYIKDRLTQYEQQFQKPIILKKFGSGIGNIFDLVDAVHYVHVGIDKNNRTIPEGFYHNRAVTIERACDVVDSVILRYNDIMANGLGNYTLTQDDIMIKDFLA